MIDVRSRRRHANEIAYDVVRTANGGERKTKIMYGAALNITQLNQYLALLIDRGMLALEPGRRYRATEKGRRFIAVYDRCMETRSLLMAQQQAMDEFMAPLPRKAPQFAAPPVA